MTFLERLQAHKGSLIRLKTQLFWYGRGGWDKNSGRLCLLLDAAAPEAAPAPAADARAPVASSTAALLLVDGQPRWIWVGGEDVEIVE